MAALESLETPLESTTADMEAAPEFLLTRLETPTETAELQSIRPSIYQEPTEMGVKSTRPLDTMTSKETDALPK